MKILLINKFYYLSGGAERYLFEWENLLRSHGHEVLIFSMSHPRNRPCAQERFFVKQVTFNQPLSPWEKIRAATRAIWSNEARTKLRALLEAEGAPDIAHLHSFMFQLTPAILSPLVERNVPIVQTCHEYSPVCVNQRLYNQRTNRICEQCLTSGPASALRARCIKGSLSASIAGYLAGLADRQIAKSRKHIQRYFAPSEFMRGKLITRGLPPERVHTVPHFIAPDTFQPSDEPGQYMLFFGRLVAQKGIDTFLQAAEKCPNIPCKIAGSGPLENKVRAQIAERGLHNIELLGHLEGEPLNRTVRSARAIVVPSEWYEPFGLVILEAMAAARPVIAARIAGPAEIIAHERDGLLFEPGNAEALSDAMTQLWNNAAQAQKLGRNARDKALDKFSPAKHYHTIIKHFEDVCA